MNFRRTSSDVAPLLFNVVSLIDVLLVLVCFLLLSIQPAAPDELSLDIDLPSARSGQKSSAESSPVILNVHQDGSVSMNGRKLGDDRLDAAIRALATVSANQTIVVRGDKAVSYERILAVLDLCRQSGIGSVGFSSLPRK